MSVALLWFRKDLRLTDSPALTKAVESGHRIVPIYIENSVEAGKWGAGGASRWWLEGALADLADQLEALGLSLILRKGRSWDCLRELIEETEAQAVFWNRCYEPWRIRIDSRIKADLGKLGIEVWSGNASLIREPWEISTKAGKPYQVYTPFARAWANLVPGSPVNANLGAVRCCEIPIPSLALGELGLRSGRRWEDTLAENWQPTRREGLRRLEEFLDMKVDDYGKMRDVPGEEGTSRLSPWLRWGQIGPREVASRMDLIDTDGKRTYHRELVWREFAYHVLFHFPDTPEKPLQPKYADFPWEPDENQLSAWKQGLTGYPIIDAGMRELWQTGWMHNRVRMIVASFLVKHLLQSWERGAEWFWDTLVDADLASNTLGWQWAGGCGADAAPYFRVFNPILQGEKFDPEGRYVRRYVPELEKVPNVFLHKPWEMPPARQVQSGCRIGKDYPAPIMEHKAGRERALRALQQIKK